VNQGLSRWLPFEWIAALRFLREGWMQTIFILAGVAMGVAVIVFMSALLTGIQTNFLHRVLNAQAHIVLQPPDEVARPLWAATGAFADTALQAPAQRLRSVDQWRKIAEQARAMPEIAVVSPLASGAAIAVRGDASRSVTLFGVEPGTYFQIVKLPDNIVAGQIRLNSDDVIIGTDLAQDLGVAVGEKLRVTSGIGTDVILTVTAIFDLGNRSVNERNAYIALRTAQSLLNLPGGVTNLYIAIHDPYAAEILAQTIAGMSGMRADSWIRTNQQFFTAVNAQTLTNTVIRLAVAISVGLGIASVLVVSVVQRSREIGILRAMGARRGQILRVFLIQGGVLGLLGSFIGSALAAGALVGFHAVSRQADGSELFPLILDPLLFLAAAVLAALTGILAAFSPSMRAARMDPVVAIRG